MRTRLTTLFLTVAMVSGLVFASVGSAAATWIR